MKPLLRPRRDVMLRLGLCRPFGQEVRHLLALPPEQSTVFHTPVPGRVEHRQVYVDRAVFVANLRRPSARRLTSVAGCHFHPMIVGNTFLSLPFVVENLRWSRADGKYWMTVVGSPGQNRVARLNDGRLVVVPWLTLGDVTAMAGLPFRLVCSAQNSPRKSLRTPGAP